MRGAEFAVAGRFAALSPQGIEGTGQERFASEAWQQQSWQELLMLVELGAERAEELVHEGESLVAEGKL